MTVCVSLLLSAGGTAVAQTAQHPPVTIMLDASDFVTVLTWASIFLGALLLVIAALGVTFFGFDVRNARVSIDNARASIDNARSSIDKEIGELRKVIEEAKTLKEKFENISKESMNDLEEIGAKVEEVADQSVAVSTTAPETRNLPDLIREVLRRSRFEWTTIGTVAKRTGLTHDQILHTVQSMSDVRIGTGKRSQALIFRFKKDGEL